MAMKAVVAAACVGVGLCLAGVALGMLYLDVREFRAAVAAAEIRGGDSDDAGLLPFVEDTSRVMAALVSGSLGAGLCGAGLVLGALEVVRLTESGRRGRMELPKPAGVIDA